MTDYEPTDKRDAPINPHCCLQQVSNWNGWHLVQCSRKRVEGNYCRQHAKMKARDNKGKQP